MSYRGSNSQILGDIILGTRSLILILFVASGIGSVSKNFKALYSPSQKFCLISKQKQKRNSEIINLIKQYDSQKTILASGGVVPLIMDPYKKIYQAGYYSEKLAKYDLLILERGGTGKTYPLTKELIENLITTCKKSGKTLIENEIYFVHENAAESCFRPMFKVWIDR